MIRLDAQLLTELGLGGLPANVAGIVLAVIYGGLEYRVGSALAERMSDDQLNAFDALIHTPGFDENNKEEGEQWLISNLPDYRSVIAEQFALVTHGFQEASGVLLRALLIGP